MKPIGGGKTSALRSRLVREALRKREPAAATPRLRLITPRSDEA